MGSCRVVVIDSILKTLATLLVPLSSSMNDPIGDNIDVTGSKTDFQLISWLLLFLSVCIDDGIDKKDQSNEGRTQLLVGIYLTFLYRFRCRTLGLCPVMLMFRKLKYKPIPIMDERLHVHLRNASFRANKLAIITVAASLTK